MKYFFFLALLISLAACDNKVKVISPTKTNHTQNNLESTGIFEKKDNEDALIPNDKTTTNFNIHRVTVLEVLPTEKYVYLKVTENQEEYWIATGKKTIDVGERYFFKDGLLKTNFESKEYNRVFDKVYLVSNLVPENHALANQTAPTAKKILKVEGSMQIKDVIERVSSLEGKEVQITGECTKLNANIMGRNWIHLKDGSRDNYDLVVTSDQVIPEGHVVTIKGTLTLNKDFGAGYRYDLLIENASLVRE